VLPYFHFYLSTYLRR